MLTRGGGACGAYFRLKSTKSVRFGRLFHLNLVRYTYLLVTTVVSMSKSLLSKVFCLKAEEAWSFAKNTSSG